MEAVTPEKSVTPAAADKAVVKKVTKSAAAEPARSAKSVKSVKAAAPGKAVVKKAVAPKVSAKATAPAKAVKPTAKPVKAAKPAKPAKETKPAKLEKADKLVRDSFTIPRSEYALLQELKLRSATLGRPAKKSEVLRAGIQALKGLDNAALLAVLELVPVIKTGRPTGE